MERDPWEPSEAVAFEVATAGNADTAMVFWRHDREIHASVLDCD